MLTNTQGDKTGNSLNYLDYNHMSKYFQTLEGSSQNFQGLIRAPTAHHQRIHSDLVKMGVILSVGVVWGHNSINSLGSL